MLLCKCRGRRYTRKYLSIDRGLTNDKDFGSCSQIHSTKDSIADILFFYRREKSAGFQESVMLFGIRHFFIF